MLQHAGCRVRHRRLERGSTARSLCSKGSTRRCSSSCPSGTRSRRCANAGRSTRSSARKICAGLGPRGTRFGRREFAYLLFTSGSTGVPKGVGVTHANVDAFRARRWSSATGLRADDRFSQMFDTTFDLSVFDMFVAWQQRRLRLLPVAAHAAQPGPVHSRARADRLVFGADGRAADEAPRRAAGRAAIRRCGGACSAASRCRSSWRTRGRRRRRRRRSKTSTDRPS